MIDTFIDSLHYDQAFYRIIKAIHIIFVVSYFAGIFYMVRLFIYHTETQAQPADEARILQKQYVKMEHLLWNIITVPAFIMMFVTGLTMIGFNHRIFCASPWDSDNGFRWIYFKYFFILGLMGYQYVCWRICKQLKNNQFKFTSLQLRLWNEGATVILFAIVFTVTLREQFVDQWYCAIGSLVIFSVMIMLIVRWIKAIRE